MKWLKAVERQGHIMREFNHSIPLMAEEIDRLRASQSNLVEVACKILNCDMDSYCGQLCDANAGLPSEEVPCQSPRLKAALGELRAALKNTGN
ncbi:hypothetical protein LCGC14_2081380 [marine sediment metagenome]|uniref:Uncharacterized protein n=1 Tax=marine sediment metagenome TaxID=412755 RepID=A0A0F9EFE9_9ZZZZ